MRPNELLFEDSVLKISEKLIPVFAFCCAEGLKIEFYIKFCEACSFDKSVHFSLNVAHFIAANSFRFRRKALPSLDKDQSAL